MSGYGVTGPQRPYTQLLRGERHRWWRPLVSTAVVLGGLVVAVLGLVVLAFAGIALDPGIGVADAADPASLGVFLERWWVAPLNSLFLATGVPIAVLAVLAGHRWGPGWVVSVEGRVRWRWLGTASLVSLVVIGLAVGATTLLSGAAYDPAPDAALLLVLLLLLTPFQAAGEEFVFRGWLSQAIGSAVARATLGALVAGGASALLFAVVHGTQGPWTFASRFAFGVVASVLVWRTGGLEASVAVHALNNMVVFVPTVLTGTIADALVPVDTAWWSFLVDAAMLSLLAVVLDALARRRRVVRTTAVTAPLPRARAAAPVREGRRVASASRPAAGPGSVRDGGVWCNWQHA